MSESKWYLRTQNDTFGPETESKLIEWAKLGRIQPGQEISDDNVIWRRVEDVPFLDMRFSIDIGDGNPRGPFNRAAAEALLASGRLPKTSTLVEVREPFLAEEKVEGVEKVEMARFELKASKGVIVRALAQDMGATLMSLRRTKIGKFDVKDAIPFDKLLETEMKDFASCVMPISKALL